MPKSKPAYTDRIVQDPEIMAGKPTVRGTQITVEAVLDHLAANPDLDDLFASYPRLTMEDLEAILAHHGQGDVAVMSPPRWRR